MECDKVRERIAAYIEGLVTPEEEALVREHIASCGQCGALYSDLKKTVEYIKGLEEVEPPGWLTQKVMTRVKEETYKPGIWKRLFYPLRVKLPLEVAATVLIAVSALYIFKTTGQDAKLAEVRPGEIATQQVQTEDTMGQKDKVNSGAKEKSASNDIKEKALLPQTVPLKEMKAAPSNQPGRDALSSVGPPQERVAEPAAPTLPAPAILMEKKDASGSGLERLNESKAADESKAKGRIIYGGSPVREELKQASAAAAPLKKMEKDSSEEDRVLRKYIFMNLEVADVDKARDEIRKHLLKFGGQIIETEAGPDKTVLIVEMDYGKVRALSERLRAIGELREPEPPAGMREGTVKVKIEIVKASDR